MKLIIEPSQSNLKEINPEFSLEGLMLKLKLQYFGHLMQRSDSLEKTLMLGKMEGRRWRKCRRWDGWMASLTQWTWLWASSGSWWWTGRPGVLLSMGSQRVRHDCMTELNWPGPRSRPAAGKTCSENPFSLVTKIHQNLGIRLTKDNTSLNVIREYT